MRKTAIIVACLLLASVASVVAVDQYLKWQDPVGYRNMTSCQAIPAGTHLTELKTLLGEPVRRHEKRDAVWLEFRTTSLAAGPILASIEESTGKVLTLRCSHDGPDTWSIS